MKKTETGRITVGRSCHQTLNATRDELQKLFARSKVIFSANIFRQNVPWTVHAEWEKARSLNLVRRLGTIYTAVWRAQTSSCFMNCRRRTTVSTMPTGRTRVVMPRTINSTNNTLRACQANLEIPVCVKGFQFTNFRGSNYFDQSVDDKGITNAGRVLTWRNLIMDFCWNRGGVYGAVILASIGRYPCCFAGHMQSK